MININKFLFSLAFVCFAFINVLPSVAQELSPSEEAQIRLQVIDLFEEYERYAAIDEDYASYSSSFRALFASSQSSVYNDLIGISKEKVLSAKDYASAMSRQSSTTRVEIKNIQFVQMKYENDAWRILCTFDKYLNITDKCGVEYASDFFNASDYLMTATIVFNPTENTCLFEKIEGEAKPIRTLGENYRVIKSSNPNDKDVLYNGKPLEFNSMGQAFVDNNGSFSYRDPEVMLKLKEEDSQCHLWNLTYKQKPLRLKFHYDLGIGEPLSISGTDKLDNIKSSGSGFGLDFGYVIPSKSKVKFGLFTGVGLSQYSMDLAYSSADYSYLTMSDVDGDKYYRHYQDLSLAQTENVSLLSVPLYADMNVIFARMFSIYLDLGVKFNMAMAHKLKAIDGQAYIYGIYPDYGNLYLNEEWGYNGFGNKSFSGMADQVELAKVPATIDIYGALGLRFNIPQTPLAIDLGVNYQMGMNNLIKMSDADRRSLDNAGATYENAIMYNTFSGMESVEHVRPLTNYVSGVKVGALRFSVGLMLKF